MGETTAISWTDHTFNPWWGCVKVSPACQHCYAETFSKRVGQKVWGVDAQRRFFGPKHWGEPLKWNAAAIKAGERRRVFCASMADVFEDRPELSQARTDLFLTIEETPALDWLLLTKRPENIRRMLPTWWKGRAWPNVWLGTTAENQEYLNARVPHLLDVPAVVHFLSLEPLLGPITFRWAMWDDWRDDEGHQRPVVNEYDGLRQVQWVIAGGESGAGCRPPDNHWFRMIRDECVAAGVAFHFKQWGGRNAKANGCELDGREWKEFPIVESAAALG